jgi:hypothetical protein
VADRHVNPFTDADVQGMLSCLYQLVMDVHATDPPLRHNHHACIGYREYEAKLKAAPTVEQNADDDLKYAYTSDDPRGFWT